MKITDEAKQLLENFLTEKKAEGIRIDTTDGCCGPNIVVSLDAPQESDKIETINGIRVAFASQVTGTEELIIDKEEDEDGAGLVLIGGKSCC